MSWLPILPRTYLLRKISDDQPNLPGLMHSFALPVAFMTMKNVEHACLTILSICLSLLPYLSVLSSRAASFPREKEHTTTRTDLPVCLLLWHSAFDMAVEDEKHNKIENIMKRRRKPRGQPCKSTPNTFSRGLPFLSYPSYPAITRHTTAGFLLLVVAIISAPTTSVLNFVLGPGREGVRVAGALAALCTSADVVRLTVTPESVLDLATLFDCEEGEFEVVWSGAVNVSETINVGRGTSLHIVGNTTVTTTSSSSTPININGSSGTSQALPEFSSGLALPTGLLSAAVGVRPGNASFGPLFYVNGGQLSMEGLAIRNGFATSSTNKSLGSGGGVQAMNSNVTFFGCEFVDNFAESMGGGIFANRSTVVITNSVFRGCRAGFQSFAGDEDMSGVGGGVSVSSNFTLCHRC